MINSCHYCYYYCYDYDDYPSCCCCSILLNDFLSLDEHDLLHLETSLIFSVPQKDYSNGKTNPHSAICILSQTSRHYSLLPRTLLPPWFLWSWISQAWLNNLNVMFMQTYFTLPFFCSPAVYGLCTLSLCSLLVSFSLYHLNQWLFALPTGFSL